MSQETNEKTLIFNLPLPNCLRTNAKPKSEINLKRLCAISNNSDPLNDIQTAITSTSRKKLQKIKSAKQFDDYLSRHDCIHLGSMKYIFTKHSSYIHSAERSGFNGLFRLNDHLFYYNHPRQQYLRTMTEKEWTNLNGRLNDWRDQIKEYENISDILKYTRRHLKTKQFDERMMPLIVTLKLGR